MKTDNYVDFGNRKLIPIIFIVFSLLFSSVPLGVSASLQVEEFRMPPEGTSSTGSGDDTDTSTSNEDPDLTTMDDPEERQAALEEARRRAELEDQHSEAGLMQGVGSQDEVEEARYQREQDPDSLTENQVIALERAGDISESDADNMIAKIRYTGKPFAKGVDDFSSVFEVFMLIPGLANWRKDRREEYAKNRRDNIQNWPSALSTLVYGEHFLVESCVAGQLWDITDAIAGPDLRGMDPSRGTLCHEEACVTFNGEYIDMGDDVPIGGDRYMYLIEFYIVPPDEDEDDHWEFDLKIHPEDGSSPELIADGAVEYGNATDFTGENMLTLSSSTKYDTLELDFTRGHPPVSQYGGGSGSTFKQSIVSSQSVYEAHEDVAQGSDDSNDDGNDESTSTHTNVNTDI